MKAEIELLALEKGEADNLGVRLPPADVFRKANIDYSAALLSVKFKIEQRGADRYVVVLSSAQPMNEPFLDLLVELDWNTGRLVREYTFLLDPPEYKGPAASVIAAPTAGTPEIKSVEMPKQPVSETRLPSAELPLAPAAAAPVPPTTTAAAAPKAALTYQVKPGDTLTKIANANKSDSVSLQQMLIALYRSNEYAFDGNNINRMRAGKILNIPDAEAAASIDQNEAARTVLAQGADFNEYRRKLGAAVAAAPERAEQRRQSVSGKITAKVEEKPAATKGAQDQLKLSKAESGRPGAGRSVQGLQEDLIAKDKALKEANERIALLEKNVQDMQKLLELKSQSGAQLQQQAAKAGVAKAVEPPKTPAPAKAPEPAKAAEPAKPAEVATAAPKAAPPKAAPKKVVAPPPPPPEPSLIDEILGNELALYGGGGFLVLLFAGYGYYAWRRKKSLQIIESSAMGAPSLAADSVFGAAAGAEAETGPDGIQGEVGQAAAVASIETEEVDPIAEADVYMAYGRDVQAEEILKEALAKDPMRQAIRAKLLEIYANRKDAKAFEAVAAEIHSATNGVGAEWEKAVSLGAQLDPGNPLYGGGAAAAEGRAVSDTQEFSAVGAAPDIVLDMGGEPEPSPGLDFDLGMGAPAAAGPAQPEQAPEVGAAPPTDIIGDLGFDLDLGADVKPVAAAPAEQPSGAAGAAALDLPVGAAEAPAEAVSSIDFDFELPSAGAAAEPAGAAAPELPPVAPEAPTEGGGGIDFDFNLDVPEQKEEAPSAPLDLSSISLDLGSPGEAPLTPDAHWQEVATKLDLAKAYQEMGDKDGARELLNEVVKEGDAAQQEQAQSMLANLG